MNPTTTPDISSTTPQAPSSWSTLWLVTARELRTRGTSKVYTISAAFIFVLLTAAVLIPHLLSNSDVTVEIGSLGADSEPVVALTGQLLRDGLDPQRSLDFQVTEYVDRAAARAALEADEVELVVVDGSEVLRKGSTGFSGSDLQDTVQEAAGILALEQQLVGTGTSPEQVAQTLRGAPLEVNTLQGASDTARDDARSFIAYAGMMLLYLAILMFGAWTLQGVTEEKSSRVVEVLLSTVRPWQLMAGKILGVGLLGLAQFVMTIAWALVLVRVTDALQLPAIPVDSAITLVVWFVLGYGLYSVLYAAAGALAGSSEDAQSVAFPISMVAVVGFLVSFQALDSPAGTLAQVTTYVPFMAPFVVPIRVAFGEIALWEHVLSAVWTATVTIGLVRVAARLYAGGALHFAGRMKLRSAWRGAETARRAG